MVFNSLNFLIFFLIVYTSYLAISHRNQNRVLLVASYCFYAAWDYRFLALMLFTTVVDYLCGNIMEWNSSPSKRKVILSTSIIINLSILGFFKYFNFFADSLVQLLHVFGISSNEPFINIILPVGISFYTFQAMSHTIDVYRNRIKPCRNFIDFALYISFFPQLVAGPIERAKNFLPQIINKRSITINQVSEGFNLVIFGLFKKIVIADNLSPTVDAIFSRTDNFASGEVFIGVLFFAFQIYCDFSGYTDIARGLAKMMGFNFGLNFNMPYFAKNPRDFWRRWHISLSSWLKDYLYISLGGSRGSEFKTYRNLIATMVLGGLWHGAAWNFVLWGSYHGLLLSIHRFMTNRFFSAQKNYQNLNRPLALAKTSISVFVMFMFTLYGWLLFRANSFEQIENMTMSLINIDFNDYLFTNLTRLGFYCWPLIMIEVIQMYKKDLTVYFKAPATIQSAGYMVLTLMIIILGNFDGTSFIYFQF
jgi:D-alanyl-lipoteichoic acid acyltransferase DltB (MBOAT superfamily)